MHAEDIKSSSAEYTENMVDRGISGEQDRVLIENRCFGRPHVKRTAVGMNIHHFMEVQTISTMV